MKFNLQDRLITCAVLILDITETLPDNKGSNHLSGQLVSQEQPQLCSMAKHNRLNHVKISFIK
jgi:hypothetical protein